MQNHAIAPMNYPAASRGILSSVLARHSVLDTPAPYLIRGLSRTGYGGIQSGLLDTGFRRYDELVVSRGVSTSVLARHSVLDTESSRAVLDTGFRRYDELAVSHGVSTLNENEPYVSES
jgi:hypothetical protein